MDIDKFNLGTWKEKLRSFIESEKCHEIYKQLKEKSRKGVKMAPLSCNTWKAFELCPYNNLKVIICGLSPYHTFYKGEPIADGLVTSCSITGKLQPSLENIYDAIEKDIFGGLNLHMKKNPDLSFLAKQGVLLMNVSLTVEEGKAGGHIPIWESFMQYIINDVFNTYDRGLIFVWLGKEAAKWEKQLVPFRHHSIVVEHPAAASYQNRQWKHENVFSRVNELIKQNNGVEYIINWDDSENPPF